MCIKTQLSFEMHISEFCHAVLQPSDVCKKTHTGTMKDEGDSTYMMTLYIRMHVVSSVKCFGIGLPSALGIFCKLLSGIFKWYINVVK